MTSHEPDEQMQEIRREFRERFAAYDAEIWDRQLKADAANGRLSVLSDRAVRDHEGSVLWFWIGSHAEYDSMLR